MNLSKSKYCNAVQCPKMLWLLQNQKEVQEEASNQAVLENGTEVGLLAKHLFGDEFVDIPFSENLQEMIAATKKALQQEKVIVTEASFAYEGNFCSVDILVKNGKQYEIYEVKSSTDIKEIYLDDISYQVYVLSSLGYPVKKACLVYLNRFYQRKGELDLKALFLQEDVTQRTKEKQNEVKKRIADIKQYMLQQEEPQDDIGMHCVSPYDCPFFSYCTRKLPSNNVFQLRRMQNKTKFHFYHQGCYRYEDLLKEKIDSKVKQQIVFELEHKAPEIHQAAIEAFLKTLSYPLYFLDFETYQQSIPLYDDVKPYMQIPFQYSLHFIESEKGTLQHREFLAEPGRDPRRKLAEEFAYWLIICLLKRRFFVI